MDRDPRIEASRHLLMANMMLATYNADWPEDAKIDLLIEVLVEILNTLIGIQASYDPEQA